jgi:hypothetical protein
MKRIYEMAQGLALAGCLYAGATGMTLALSGRANADGYGVICEAGLTGDPPQYICGPPNTRCPMVTAQGVFLQWGQCLGQPDPGIKCGCFTLPQ